MARLSKMNVWSFVYQVVLMLLNTLLQNAEAEESTPPPQSNENEVADNLVKGLATGFGVICGVILFFCVLWCVCCGNYCQENKKPLDNRRILRKIGPTPSPPRSGTTTRSTVRSFQSS
ncbi:uncharacterized protein LOC121370950 [Gigantopelta aegis]|uniref:uncharacterized protein LOC121370950 n=1 Tax=Gigantopelta aegis TaxID=1735272 RepID=UPI001B88868A|nr:uncharacterized protein LOC121370950 [Gigantopelta aegis]